MAESMWDDVKKLGDLVYNQTKEQKDILLLKLRMASFSSKRETAFGKLGSLVYKPLKDGKENITQDKKVTAALSDLTQIEEDIALTEKELEELRVKTADQRSELGDELGKTWEKTKSAITPKDEPGGGTKTTKSKTDAESASPAKKAKKSRAKSSSAKTAKDRKKGPKESDKS